MMIDSPGFTVSTRSNDSNEDEIRIQNGESTELIQRVQKVIDRFRDRTSIPLFWKIDLSSSIPLHNGLGGGTQLALAVAYTLSRYYNDKIKAPNDLALAAGRGKRSSIGTFGFFQGGFLIDSGKTTPDDIGTCEVRLPVPENWRVLLVTPNEQHGLAGSAEIEAFKQLPPLGKATADKLTSILHDDMSKAVEHSNLNQFQNSVHTFGQIVGEQFSSVQHGVYATAFAQEIADAMIERGIGGVGQTSWGPTLFGFFDSSEEELILKKVQSIPGIDRCAVRTSKPKNNGLDFTDE